MVVAVNDKRRAHAEHQNKVGQSQVDHEVVGWRAEGLGAAEYVEDDEVTTDGKHGHAREEEGHKPVPHFVHGGEAVPVGVYQVQHVLSHCVYHSVVAIGISVSLPRDAGTVGGSEEGLGVRKVGHDEEEEVVASAENPEQMCERRIRPNTSL